MIPACGVWIKAAPVFWPDEIGNHRRILGSQLINMPTETFQASRWTAGNFLFPTVIEVSDKAVIRRKRSWFSTDEMSISIHKVASVHIRTGMVWSDIRIESSGGTDPLTSHGHSKGDARRIKELVEAVQATPEHRCDHPHHD